ncbi:ATPase/GTPase, AAA15 family [Chitinophaga sp. CF118]|uniref:AAA family ATPase n=1 Tax=Chitinophaga sp. CF118 TaxID=1884367 RepID=UPI0008E3E36F|nr:ATP-binding protein [Chitinophaga sp. CF118]SFD79458.1 ATPase/GTPase, AAA15 family [Chitinophaga sp. CF118]
MFVQLSIANFLSFKEEITFSMVSSSLKDKKIEEEDVIFQPFESVRFNLLRSAVIYGANASGKSNFCKALKFMRWFVLNSSTSTQVGEPIDILNFKLSSETEHTPSYFEIIFIKNDFQYRYGFEADTKRVVTEWLFQKKLKTKSKELEIFYRHENEPISLHSKFKIGHDLVIKNMIRPNALLLSVAAQFNDQIANEIFEWFRDFKVLSGLTDENYLSYTMNLLQNESYRQRIIDFTKYADLGIDDLQINATETADEYAEEGWMLFEPPARKPTIGKEINSLISIHQKFDVNSVEIEPVQFHFNKDESHGTIKYFGLAGPILDTLDNGKVLAIDELDSKLHPLLTEKIISLFNSPVTNPKNAQLIFTTHDTNLLSTNQFRRDQIWFTQKNRYGASDLYALSTYKVRNDASFEKDYLQGRYGAIPALRNFGKLFNLKT